jgi:cytoskeletal protein RodZ
MGTENRQVNRKKVVGLVLCVVLVILLAGFIQALLASATNNGSDKATLTPIAGQRPASAASTATAKAAPTAYATKVRIATATPNPASTPNTGATATSVTAAQPPMTGGTSLLFGTNLSLQDRSDQVLTAAATRALVREGPVGM